MGDPKRVPPGIRLFPVIRSARSRTQTYRAAALILTFLAYALLHASRKASSVAKNALTSSNSLHSPLYSNSVLPTWPSNLIFHHRAPLNLTSSRLSLTSGWAPFNNTSGTSLLGDVDVAFLASYSMGMYVAGHLGDRLDLRLFLSSGMMGSGMLVILFGMAYWWNVHWLGYFLIVQIIGGFVQATGWPSVVAIVGNWFGKKKRGLIMGIWNAHTSVGNIWGTLMASAVLAYGWGWSFVVPGSVLVAGGVFMFLFLVVDPTIVGLPSPYENGTQEDAVSNEGDAEKGYLQTGSNLDWQKQSLLQKDKKSVDEYEEGEGSEHAAVGFFEAWAIPRVAPYAFCLFFAKLVAYTFLYWLPYYIEHTEINGEYLSDTTSGNLSTVFDVGGTIGGILAGYISDRLNARAIVAASFTFATLPALLLYRMYGSETLWLNAVLLFFGGICVNGPYALITTAVAADLGTHESLKGSSKALATVTAIIDGTGSIGAAIGPLITGYIVKTGWNSVFIMLILSASISGLLITGLVIEELKEISLKWRLQILGQKELS